MMNRNNEEKPKCITESFEHPRTEDNNTLFDYIFSGLK